MRWGRIVFGAFLIELALVVAAIPLFALLPNPFIAGAENATGDYTMVFASIAVAAFVAGALGGWWVARPVPAGRAMHGLWTGIIATVLYLIIASIPPNTVATVFNTYGAFWFLTANGLRIAGAVLGAGRTRGGSIG